MDVRSRSAAKSEQIEIEKIATACTGARVVATRGRNPNHVKNSSYRYVYGDTYRDYRYV